MRNDYLVIGILLCAALAYHQWSNRKEYPLAVVRSEPLQKNLLNAPVFNFKEYTLKPLAEFEVKALVLGAKHYFFGRDGALAPVDLALGWGAMSDGNVLKFLDISQGNRWYFYNYKELPIPNGEIISHSANMHLIPATPDVAKAIKRARRNDIVEFKGYLVHVKAQDGWGWNTSTSRNDTGQGSCELVWVDEFSIVE